MGNLKAKEYKQFDDIKHTTDEGVEFWYARELAPVLEYAQWRNFSKVIDKAMLACKNSGFVLADHFADISKTIAMPKGATKSIPDYQLSRYACYLIVQNGDPRKEVIAFGQTYFAIQTRRQEVADAFNQLDEDSKRLVVRGDVKNWNSMLAEAAHRAGITEQADYAEFQNAGYMGLYGGLRVADIHKRKGLAENEKILDHMSSVELAANLFRITQTEEIMSREQPQGLNAASSIHHTVGKEVRQTIERVGGTMPEDLPTPEKSITEIEKAQLKQLKKDRKKLMLDE